MKLYDIKMCSTDNAGKRHWHSIGVIFAADDAHLSNEDDKPAGFAINYPPASGVVVLRKPKTDSTDAEVSS